VAFVVADKAFYATILLPFGECQRRFGVGKEGYQLALFLHETSTLF